MWSDDPGVSDFVSAVIGFGGFWTMVCLILYIKHVIINYYHNTRIPERGYLWTFIRDTPVKSYVSRVHANKNNLAHLAELLDVGSGCMTGDILTSCSELECIHYQIEQYQNKHALESENLTKDIENLEKKIATYVWSSNAVVASTDLSEEMKLLINPIRRQIELLENERARLQDPSTALSEVRAIVDAYNKNKKLASDQVLV